MAVANRDRVRNGLDRLKDGLAPFVEREMQRCHGADWWPKAQQALGGWAVAGQRTLDTQAVLGIVIEFWNDVFKDKLGPFERGLIDLDAGTCTGPGGQTTADLRHTSGGQQGFVFPAPVCAAGPLRAQCVAGAGGRTIAVHPQEALLQQARAFQASPAFDEVRRRRQAAAHRIARLVQLGIRQARSVGRAKTLFHLAMAAAVANLTLLAGADALRAAPAAAFTALGRLLTVLLRAVFARRTHPAPPAAQRSLTRCARWWGPTAPRLALAAVTSRAMAGFRPDF